MPRKPTESERRLLRRLTSILQWQGGSALWTESVEVEDMEDGGMGSLRLYLHDHSRGDKYNPGERSVIIFSDADGTEVWATLYRDETGAPWELDMWKVDNSPLIAIPKNLPEPKLE